ncbi:type 1 glutamine amidotransferase domain-containing protein [Algoriphagus lacus]|uniref:Type 1 glutamine amidotransferase domain-containing protein n=1 Tax=Algoriphagus lacus TaxID=2056311 RepID=A0A418PNN3_9BACT|nr:type 1 glutamine amidotransferase domain-containing protein [Algoriphagus lacus]RIW13363.1 type 1 glutamine amidotransferase domain-containing protein [Algoriphagus lacus]
MKKILILILLALLTLDGYGQKLNNEKLRILLVVSSYGKDGGESRPGFELDELSQAYWILKDNNVSIDLASPKGGKVTPDEFNPKKPYNLRFLEDKEAMGLLENTRSTAELVQKSYDGIFVIGGKGAMFDLPVDPSLQDLIAKTFKESGKIGAVCHGAAAFVNIKVDDKYIIADQKLTGYCNSEEEKFGKKWVGEFQFLLENKLLERGAVYEKGFDMLPFAVTDTHFVTGQNPYSTSLVVEDFLKSLGVEVAARDEYFDVKSMFLVRRALNGEYEWVKNEISKNQSAYDLELIAVYGYYELLHSMENKEVIKRGLSVIELVSPYFFNEHLAMETAKAYLKVEEKAKAKLILQELIYKGLLTDKAEEILNGIN